MRAPFYLSCLHVGVLALGTSASFAEDEGVKTVLDDRPIVSSRGAGMSDALTPFADDWDALGYNPAGIGSRDKGGREKFLRKLYFPKGAAAANQNVVNYYSEFQGEGGNEDRGRGKAVAEAHDGQRQFARGQISLLGFAAGPFAMVPIYDQQIAAVSKTGTDGQEVDLKYRQTSGVLGGIRFGDPGSKFSIGASAHYFSMTQTDGTFAYDSIVNTEDRDKAFKDKTGSFSGYSPNVGLMWRLPKKPYPTIAVAVRNVGNPTYKDSSKKIDDLKLQEDASLAFGLSPQIKSWGFFNFSLEANKLTQGKTELRKKFRTGAEFLLGGQDSDARLGLRGGYEITGPSFGLVLNVGLIAIEAGSQMIDISSTNEIQAERRHSVSAQVNVVSF